MIIIHTCNDRLENRKLNLYFTKTTNILIEWTAVWYSNNQITCTVCTIEYCIPVHTDGRTDGLLSQIYSTVLITYYCMNDTVLVLWHHAVVEYADHVYSTPSIEPKCKCDLQIEYYYCIVHFFFSSVLADAALAADC